MSENKMTPAPWEIDGFDMTAGIQCMHPGANNPGWKHVFRCDYGYATPEKFVELNKTNAAAIVSAVNNTYGAGINPEAVPELLAILEDIIMDCGLTSTTVSVEQYRKAKAALEKAKL